MKSLVFLLISLPFFGQTSHSNANAGEKIKNKGVTLIVLGNVQDAGSPQAGCKKECCASLWKNPKQDRKITSLGIIDHDFQKNYIFDISPDFTQQVQLLQEQSATLNKTAPDGIFITHAHIGHYTGLMFLGREAMNSKNVPVYAMPRLKKYLENNGPWSQLVTLNNIAIQEIQNEVPVQLSTHLNVTPIQVPHRDEYSETVGYIIKGPNKKALFIPDIDKWSTWKHNIADLIKSVDYAFLDATFYDAEEVGFRNISEIPHPFVVESMELFKGLAPQDKKKIHFIHFNHTNKLLIPDSKQTKTVLANGFAIARLGDQVEL
ncbi:pyrroloquinoline quinone biosynthesis protein PqqB [Chryseobacterium lactis]|uniref:MBL fold metallo-hydrolase n=1 Tax=Chryseobacterium lactis TaxID=1241981 RepID=A0A3G6RP40_CHRLC|nr:MBL fold metallo-hydrolase [Chryseobacterium lactis]AZA80591.1 MBL fold metallo-hydrolase [Chryseobacterium lactis]AZB05593.1 MBL fold metallo-hydrolase [Chryseobacterium lactis]PNW13688.1 pyrroloquinoline quinone biosynthesis protein PqqB [Chryseobacterium lactis]